MGPNWLYMCSGSWGSTVQTTLCLVQNIEEKVSSKSEYIYSEYIYISIYTYMHIYTHIYIWREKERDVKRNIGK